MSIPAVHGTARRVLPFLLAIAASALAALPAQSNVNGTYDSSSFEAPRYRLGALPGLGFADGQDGWMLFDSLALQPNLAAATVQTGVALAGERAVRFDAARLTPHCFGELRRNAMFTLTTGVIEIELDFLITTSSHPSGAWELYTQPAPNPQSAQMRWWIDSSGRVEFLTTPARTLVSTNHFVSRGVWHHARSVVDILGDRTEIHIDGVLVGSGRPIGVFANLPDHGFTQINAWDAGDDAIHIDNMTIRERRSPHGLSRDLDHLPIARRSTLQLHLFAGAARAGQSYALLGSFTGTTPGIALGSIVLPLQPDWFFDFLLQNLGSPSLPGFLGTFDGGGNAEATLDTGIPVPPEMLGMTVSFAYATLQLDAVSEVTQIRITAQ